MARKIDKAVEPPSPVAAPVPVESPEVWAAAEAAFGNQVPTYTLRADRRIDMLALILCGAPESVVREFELYEEKHR